MDKKIKIMISQPMRGKTNERIKEERAKLIKRLEKEINKHYYRYEFAEETLNKLKEYYKKNNIF